MEAVSGRNKHISRTFLIAAFARRGGLCGISARACSFGVPRSGDALRPSRKVAAAPDLLEQFHHGCLLRPFLGPEEPEPSSRHGRGGARSCRRGRPDETVVLPDPRRGTPRHAVFGALAALYAHPSGGRNRAGMRADLTSPRPGEGDL